MELKKLLGKMDKTRTEKLNYITQYQKDIKESLELETFLVENKGQFIITSWLDTEVLYPHDLVKFKPTSSKELKLLIVAGVPFKFHKVARFNHITNDDDYSWGGLWKESVNIYLPMRLVKGKLNEEKKK